MNYDLAKRNRLNGKFNFKRRDWQLELDGVDDPPEFPPQNHRPRRPKVLWKRDDSQQQYQYDDQDAG